MEQLLLGVFIYEVIGLFLIGVGVYKYLRNEKKEQERKYENYN
jgi:hypothetical protein